MSYLIHSVVIWLYMFINLWILYKWGKLMSADNGVYILKTSRRDDPTKSEYRVAHAQAIENVTQQDAFWADIQPAYAVSIFGSSVVFDNKADALIEAGSIEDEILSDEFCPILEYGICEVELPFGGSFPDMTIDEARRAIDTYHDPGNLSECQTL